jgi:hypothetical protein
MPPAAELHIAYSKLKLAKVVACGVGLVAVSAALAFDWLPGEGGSVFARAVGWIGLLFFGLCLGALVWRFFASRGDVVTITSEGLIDRRVASGLIPWRAIKAIDVWEYSGQKVVVLKLDPEVEKGLELRRETKWSRNLNRALGADGICIASMGLSVGHDQLLHEIRARVDAAHREPNAGSPLRLSAAKWP